MGKNPAFQFYPADWLNDLKLQTCSLAAHGLLIDLMCLMHQSERYGYLLINGQKPSDKTLIKCLRTHHKPYQHAIKELLSSGVLKTDSDGVIYCKRMVEDERIRKVRAECGKKGGNPNLLNQTLNQTFNQNPTPSSSSSSSSSKIKPPIPPFQGQINQTKKPTTKKSSRPHFQEFWAAYPRKVAKSVAEKSFSKINPDDALFSKIMSGLAKYKNSAQWTKNGGEFIPHPSTWLNQKRWEDELSVEPAMAIDTVNAGLIYKYDGRDKCLAFLVAEYHLSQQEAEAWISCNFAN